MGQSGERGRTGVMNARRDLVTGGITVAATILFLGTGSSAIGEALAKYSGEIGQVDHLLAIALILNVALLLFGWRRYRDLQHEVSERSAAEERALVLAARDPLTGLLNRRSLLNQGAALIARLDRSRAVAVLMIDVDHFKTINDLHGHSAGDDLLKACATAITGALPAGGLTARLGGDEFACAFPVDAIDIGGQVDAVADVLLARLFTPFDLDGVRGQVTASIGMVRSDAECGTIDALMRRADIAMYAAKKAGRNRAAWFDASMERELMLRNTIEAGLREGIPRGEIIPYYEQQIDLSTGHIQGFEVLARWRHPTRGLIPPDVFIPVAEEAGLISDLSTAVMRQAFEDAKGWDPSLTISVNISPAQLKDPWLAQKIVKLLVETGFPPHRLEIEITESALFDNIALAQSIIGSLKNQGIRIALDDFGTGYSSLAHLRALPFDRLKIDKSFVLSMIADPESAAIVNAITRLGESLSLPITAEGVEDAAIIEQLKAIGCHKGQGWHYGKPIPVKDVRRLLAERSLLVAGRGAQPDREEPGEPLRIFGK